MNLQIEQAVAILKAGGLVAFPTETVYGLGADASQAGAVDKIFTAKERPANHPLIVHIATINDLEKWALDVPPAAFALAKLFWPGPLTLVLKKQPHVLASVTGGQETIGLRIPRHPIAQALLQGFGSGIAAPSANKFTHISPTSAQAVAAELGAKVDMILDGGDCEVGLESTIVDLSRGHPVILRPGMITAETIAEALGLTVIRRAQDEKVLAPGAHHLHYAPHTKTVLLRGQHIPVFLDLCSPADFPMAVLAHSPLRLTTHPQVKQISLPADPDQYARALYQTLRQLDSEAYQHIIIEALPDLPVWEAVRDRLFKASHQS